MGRPAKVPLRDRINVVKSFMRHFVTRKMPAYTSPIWIQMSEELNGRWSPHDVYTNVRENRSNIVGIAREELAVQVLEDHEVPKLYPINETENIDPTSNDENSTSDSDDPEWCLGERRTKRKVDAKIIETKKVQLVLTEQEWDSIKPNGTVVYGERNTEILQRGVWTNVISIAFWKQHKTCCAFVYKRANVKEGSDNGSYIIDIYGKCKSSSCGNTFRGHGEKHPDERGIVIYVDTRDTSLESHEEVKRPLNGARRKQAAAEMASEGSTVWKRRQAREFMQDSDLEPAFLPNGDVLRQAKKEGIHARLNVQPGDSRDLIRTVENISADPNYVDLVQAVGSLPFYVFFGTPAQMDAYTKYLKINKSKSVISVDATGSVVDAIIRPDGTKTGHIFLYSVVVNFEGLTQPVHQMLSEKHDIDFIEYWLRQWLRKGAGKPNEAVCDYSRALINALCLAFNNRTIKSYLDILFAIIENTQGVIERPSTIIRIDVAHFIHIVCRWPCFDKVTQPRIKDFFVRCVALMVECTTLHQFQKVFTLTCAVGLQMNEDSELDLEVSLIRTTKDCRLRLEDYIATRRIEEKLKVHHPRDEEDYELGPFAPKTVDGTSKLDDTSKVDDDTKSRNRLIQWVALQRKHAEKTIRDGRDLNAFYLPTFIERLYKLAKEFPLWTAVAVPPSRSLHATSSVVEGYFRDIKTRVFTVVKAPARVDIFIKELARNVIGETRLFISKIKKAEMLVAELEKKKLLKDKLDERKQENQEPVLQKPERQEPKKTETIEARTHQTREIKTKERRADEIKFVTIQTAMRGTELDNEVALQQITDSMPVDQYEDTFIPALLDQERIGTGTDQIRKLQVEEIKIVTKQAEIKVTKLDDDALDQMTDSFTIDQHENASIPDLPDQESTETGTDLTRNLQAELIKVAINQSEIKIGELHKGALEDTFIDLHLLPGDLSFIDSDAHMLEISSFVDISVNDSDLMSAENWRAKAPLQKSVDDLSDNDSIGNGQLDAPTDVPFVPNNLIVRVSNPNVFLEHSYSATDTSQSPIEVAETSIDETFDNRVENQERSNTAGNLNDMLNANPNVQISFNAKGQIRSNCGESDPDQSASVEGKENMLPVSKTDENVSNGLQKPGVKKPSKYFKCFPEIRQRNLLTAKLMKPHLLPNGNLCRRGVQVNGDTVFVRNTCPFDSLVHVLMTRAIDDVDYASCLEKSTNETLNFVSTFMKSGVTSDILLKRVNILKNFYDKKIALQTEKRVLSYTIDTWDSIENLVKHVMISEPTVYKREECSHCVGRNYSYATIAPNHNTIARRGFGALQSALAFKPVVNGLKCNSNCPGKFNLFSDPHVHLFIDLDIRNIMNTSSKQLRARSLTGLECALEEMPRTIELSVRIEGRKKVTTAVYSLAGLVGYTPGHFIAYCLRDSGTWQMYNDLREKIISVKSSQTIQPHLAVYIRQQQKERT